MKRILATALTVLISGSTPLRAQAADGPSTQELNENIKHLQGTVDDLNASQGDLRKQIQSLAREISEVREKAGKPTGNFATQEDLKRLADAIEKVDRQRQNDYEKMVGKLSDLAKTLSATSTGSGTSGRRPPPPKDPPKDPVAEPVAGKQGEQDGFYYKVKSGDTFSSIAKAYRDTGIKVYTADIEKANPGIDSSKLKVDQKIFIPAPAPKDKAK